jgi:TPP-dependent pyruvate/acetoin dehydrogenase alpha subunit
MQAKRLQEAGLLSPEAFASMREEVSREMDQAVDWAARGSLPEPADLFRHVYAD